MQKSSVEFRQAIEDDLVAIVALLADDILGAKRERFSHPLPSSYHAAFDAIKRDPNNELIVCTRANAIIGVLQLTYIPYITYQGSWRALIEGVRVASSERNSGIGAQLFEYAIARARKHGCFMVQLTTDKARPDALRFYEKLGFKASHEGMKMILQT
jgi:GNAT superfamily N-acetyltransferase